MASDKEIKAQAALQEMRDKMSQQLVLDKPEEITVQRMSALNFDKKEKIKELIF